jgi:hypothetical protein
MGRMGVLCPLHVSCRLISLELEKLQLPSSCVLTEAKRFEACQYRVERYVNVERAGSRLIGRIRGMRWKRSGMQDHSNSVGGVVRRYWTWTGLEDTVTVESRRDVVTGRIAEMVARKRLSLIGHTNRQPVRVELEYSLDKVYNSIHDTATGSVSGFETERSSRTSLSEEPVG